MTMTMGANQQRFGGPLAFDSMSSYSHHPQFTDPWATSSSAAGTMGQENHSGRNGTSASVTSYASLPATAAPAGSPPMPDAYRQQDLLAISQVPFSNSTYAPSPARYDPMGAYAPAPIRTTFAMPPE